MKYSIENEFLKVEAVEKGAELSSIWQKKHQIEYLWSGDASYWAKKSPVLFPIVGTLKDNAFIFENRSYSLGRHGFAREKLFTLTKQSAEYLEFTLTDDKETLANYPFHFQFQVIYQLRYDDLDVSYVISNTGGSEMYFSVGAHPAFRVPLVNGTKYEDYYLQFEMEEDAGRWPISREGLIEAEPTPLLRNMRRLPLTKELFLEDALVFKNLRSQKVELASGNTGRGVELSFPGFPYLGIWAAKNADFVCIEPWCGIADSVNSDQQLVNKEGIEMLPPAETFKRTWTARIF
jgi:galactose mutarotase-like enzyme